MSKSVYIVAAKRTPIGSFGGQLSGFSATQLGSFAIKGALDQIGLSPDIVDEVFMGNVCSANLGQAPAKQASLGADIPNTVPCTTVNKVCASGMKSIMFGAQSIMLGHQDIVVAGGMESMSNIPYYIPNARFGYKFGDGQLIDGLTKDGLTDSYDNNAMGVCADKTAEENSITRTEQDDFAIQSYQRSSSSTIEGKFIDEIIPISIPQRKKDPVLMTEDEEYKKVIFEKIPSLRPAFSKDGTVTAANASTLNDGAAAVILMSEEKVSEYNLNPIAKIVSFADASHEPDRFTTAPILAVPKALKIAGLNQADIDFFEVNEAFAVVTMAFNKKLNVSESIVNVNGGACSLGHPLGASGARITITLLSVLNQNSGKYGVATLCNGGGGASAIVLERID